MLDSIHFTSNEFLEQEYIWRPIAFEIAFLYVAYKLMYIRFGGRNLCFPTPAQTPMSSSISLNSNELLDTENMGEATKITL